MTFLHISLSNLTLDKKKKNLLYLLYSFWKFRRLYQTNWTCVRGRLSSNEAWIILTLMPVKPQRRVKKDGKQEMEGNTTIYVFERWIGQNKTMFAASL